jgi:hypothetical protein
MERCGRSALYVVVLLFGLLSYVFLAVPDGLSVFHPLSADHRTHHNSNGQNYNHIIVPPTRKKHADDALRVKQPLSSVSNSSMLSTASGSQDLYLHSTPTTLTSLPSSAKHKSHRRKKKHLEITFGVCRGLQRLGKRPSQTLIDCDWERDLWLFSFVVVTVLVGIVAILRLWRLRESSLSSCALSSLPIVGVFSVFAAWPRLFPLLAVVGSVAYVSYQTAAIVSVVFLAQRTLFVCLHSSSSDEFLQTLSSTTEMSDDITKTSRNHIVLWPFFSGSTIALRSRYVSLAAIYLCGCAMVVYWHWCAWVQSFASSQILIFAVSVQCGLSLSVLLVSYCNKRFRLGLAMPSVLSAALLFCLLPLSRLSLSNSLFTSATVVMSLALFVHTLFTPAPRNIAIKFIEAINLASLNSKCSDIGNDSNNVYDDHVYSEELKSLLSLSTSLSPQSIDNNSFQQNSSVTWSQTQRWEVKLTLVALHFLVLPLLLTNWGDIVLSRSLPSQTLSSNAEIDALVVQCGVIIGWMFAWMTAWFAIWRWMKVRNKFQQQFISLHRQRQTV